MNILQNYPAPADLLKWHKSLQSDKIYEVNGHVHSPYSFSAFSDFLQLFGMAVEEKIYVLGINDFFVTTGYSEFYKNAIRFGIFPLFNIEFISLLKEEQSKGIRINDPNNPGRCYFSGKGLNHPFSLSKKSTQKLQDVVSESQVQVKKMIEKANAWFQEIHVPLALDFSTIQKKYAKDLVRERHIAKAIRIAVFEAFPGEEDRKKAFKLIYGGKDSKMSMQDNPGLENEIRGQLLKSGGKAFVEEDDKAFLSLEEVMALIIEAGGIPCYPVLLDDKNGVCTEFETDMESLAKELSRRHIGCIELIPGRNDFDRLKEFVRFFNAKGFVILLGTEHNAPDMIPLTCDTRGNKPLDEELRKISYEGACIIAAHQYLHAKNLPGFMDENGKPELAKKEFFVNLGKAVIEKFIHQ